VEDSLENQHTLQKKILILGHTFAKEKFSPSKSHEWTAT
jgi:hypothetical protein